MEYIYTFQMNSQFQIIIFKILWNGNTDHKATKNLEANTNTCNFVFTFFFTNGSNAWRTNVFS